MPKEATTKRATATREEGKAKRAKKDPNAPKRPLSAYMFFSQDWRERVKTDNESASFGEIGKLLGAKWKTLNETEKKPYEDMAARDKKRHESEKAAYEAK